MLYMRYIWSLRVVLFELFRLIHGVLIVVFVGELLEIDLWLVEEVTLEVLLDLLLLFTSCKLLQLTQNLDIKVMSALVHCQPLLVLVVNGNQDSLITELSELNGFVY